MKNVSFALIQLSCDEDQSKNAVKTFSAIREAASKGAQVICLQELFQSVYFCYEENPSFFDLAQTIPGPLTNQLGDLAKELGVVIVASMFEKRAAGIFHNTTAVIDADGKYLGKYRKMHIPDDPGFYEKYYFTPGDLGFKPIETSIGKLGVLICWDQWFPEAARLMALAGAELLIYPTAIGWDNNDNKEEQQRQLDAWITIQRSHAVANGIPVIACNRIGFEQSPDSAAGINFWGNSFIAGPQGEIIKQADDSESSLLTCTLDKSRTEYIRQIWPFLRDRRIDAYNDLTKRFID